MTRYIKHIAGEMTDKVQCCIICGYELANHNNIVFIGAPPMPWPAGEPVYDSATTGIRHFTTELNEDEDIAIPCTL